jgi:uncharacterized protein
MSSPVSSYLLIKLVSRCNLACTYCYWFRDETVYDKSALLSEDVQHAFIDKLGVHIRRHGLSSFRCIFHGGEPMLFGYRRFRRLLIELHALGRATGCEIEFSITTNAVLVTEEWASLFADYDVHAAVSIDGPAVVHDRRRVDHKNNRTHEAVIQGYWRLKKAGVDPSIIAVCDPESNPLATLTYLADDLDCSRFDVLPPDLNHNDNPASIATYYISLFDAWYDRYFDRGIRVRFLISLVRAVLGLQTNSDSFGYGPLHTVSLTTDGFMEPNDVLRIGGAARTASGVNVFHHTFDDVRNDPTWRGAYDSALRLCAQCEECRYRNACGGGHLSHRWSDTRGYDNPSVYCSDLMQIFDHVRARVWRDVFVQRSEGPCSLLSLDPANFYSASQG